MVNIYHDALHERARFYRFLLSLFVGASVLEFLSALMVLAHALPVDRTSVWLAVLFGSLAATLTGWYACHARHKRVRDELLIYCDCW